MRIEPIAWAVVFADGGALLHDSPDDAETEAGMFRRHGHSDVEARRVYVLTDEMVATLEAAGFAGADNA